MSECVAPHATQKTLTTEPSGFLMGPSNLKQLESYMRDLEKGPLPNGIVKSLDEAWLISKQDALNYWHLELKYGYDTKESLFGNP